MSRSWVEVLNILSFYLESCIWPDAISRWIQQRVCINLVQISENVRRRPWQWLDKRSGQKAWAVNGCLDGLIISQQTEQGEADEEHAEWHYFGGDGGQWVQS
jgi:hypothetical protein